MQPAVIQRNSGKSSIQAMEDFPLTSYRFPYVLASFAWQTFVKLDLFISARLILFGKRNEAHGYAV
jgi:hypothetical protein